MRMSNFDIRSPELVARPHLFGGVFEEVNWPPRVPDRDAGRAFICFGRARDGPGVVTVAPAHLENVISVPFGIHVLYLPRDGSGQV